MKKPETNKNLLSLKRLLVYVASVAILGLLSCLSAQARDLDRFFPHESSFFELIDAEPLPIIPNTTNYYDLRIGLTNALFMNLVIREYARTHKPEHWQPVSVEPRIRLEEWMICTDDWCIRPVTNER